MDLLRSVLKMHIRSGYRPDFERFRRALTSRTPGPVPFGDIFADIETVGHYLNEPVFDFSSVAADPKHHMSPWAFLRATRYVNQTIRFCLGHSWDYAYSFSMIPFQGFTYDLADNTAEIAQDRKRTWVNDHRGPIQNWDDYERYPWPTDIGSINLLSRIMARSVPDGMKVLAIPGGVFEWTSFLMGLEPFCYALADQPDLVDALIQKVSNTVFAVVEDLMDEPNIGGIFMGDDLGYTSGTMISPKILRQRFLPQVKRIVDLVHSTRKVFVFHSCGNMYAVMDDLIDAGIDAKHSFEDKILPIEQVYEKWGDRTALIGGVDLHLLAVGSEEEIRRRTRQILDACAPGGHYVLGTGNSVANYIPLKNYQVMLDEGRKWNEENYGREH